MYARCLGPKKKVADEVAEEMLDFKAIGTHAGNMSLHQLFAFVVCDRWVVLQKAIITGRFCFRASATSRRRRVASETMKYIYY